MLIKHAVDVLCILIIGVGHEGHHTVESHSRLAPLTPPTSGTGPGVASLLDQGFPRAHSDDKDTLLYYLPYFGIHAVCTINKVQPRQTRSYVEVAVNHYGRVKGVGRDSPS